MKSTINFLSLILFISLITTPMEAPKRILPDQEERNNSENDSYSDEEAGPLIKKKRESTRNQIVEKLIQKIVSKELYVFKVGTKIQTKLILLTAITSWCAQQL